MTFPNFLKSGSKFLLLISCKNRVIYISLAIFPVNSEFSILHNFDLFSESS